jgi:release factor glutamine methyltransferase
MSENSKQPAPTINTWLTEAVGQLQTAGISSAQLDAELILAHALGRERTWIIAHRDDELVWGSPANSLLAKRLQRIPLAYLVGRREFYGREFIVNKNVLIPRPETEEMIEQLKLLRPQAGQRLIDVGTGSGAIAITAALEFPGLHVEAVDVSPQALDVVRNNAHSLSAKLDVYESDLLANARHSYDFILANLPYVDQAWERSAETNFEPALALFAEDDGLQLIKRCLQQATSKLNDSGYVLLEADPRQFDDIIAYAKTHGFSPVRINDYVLTLQR